MHLYVHIYIYIYHACYISHGTTSCSLSFPFLARSVGVRLLMLELIVRKQQLLQMHFQDRTHIRNNVGNLTGMES